MTWRQALIGRLKRLGNWLGGERYLSLMIEAGSRLNWAALEAGVVDRIFFC